MSEKCQAVQIGDWIDLGGGLPNQIHNEFNNFTRYYCRDKEHKLKNAAHVDNSYKWAGGGFLSTAGDLVQFGNAMLYSFQQQQQSPEGAKEVVFKPGPFNAVNQLSSGSDKDRKLEALPGYLKPETMAKMWEPLVKVNKPDSLNPSASYGLGWFVMPGSHEYAFCKDQR